MAVDPIRKFNSWWRAAERAGCPKPDAMSLATVDGRGRPSIRYVLLKNAEKRGFVFYTNQYSRKGRELAANRYAALAWYWDATGRQVRAEGRVSFVSAAEADAYWQHRPRGSQLASAASDQSATVASRRELTERVRGLERVYANQEVPRPPHWRGYVLAPSSIEFWTRREPRLHDRRLFVLRGGQWTEQLLQP